MSLTSISVEQAEQLILQQLREPAVDQARTLAPRPEFLAEDLIADRDFPPFHRVAMDGIAIRYSAWDQGIRRFAIQGLQAAGASGQALKNELGCLEVMTGAMLPEGCDTVIPYEQIRMAEGYAQVSEGDVELGQHIHRQASDRRRGDVIVSKGTLLSSSEWAVAATIGKAQVRVFRRPRIALVATGDELVAIHQTPEPFQIRRSNDIAITSSLQSHGFHDVSSFYCPDDEAVTLATVQHALENFDTLIFTGGVSMGKLDLLPRVFQRCGIRQIFHKIQQRPGKPMYFGVSERQQLVFGLPGNPVSAIVCLHRYVLTALMRGLDQGGQPRKPLYAKLSEDYTFEKPLTLFRPVKLSWNDRGEFWVERLSLSGSGDFAGLCLSDGFIELRAEQSLFRQGEAVPLWLWRSLG